MKLEIRFRLLSMGLYPIFMPMCLVDYHIILMKIPSKDLGQL